MNEMEDLQRSFVRKMVFQGPNRSFTATHGPDGGDYPKRFIFDVVSKAIDAFLEGKRHDRLIIMPGLRGTGKSTLLAQSYQHLVQKEVPADRILFFSQDEARSMVGSDIATMLRMYESVIMREFGSLTKGQSVFILVDEAQYDPNWAMTLKALHDSTPQVFIMVTGSSAIHLSSSTDVARRAKFTRVPPLSLAEFNMLGSPRGVSAFRRSLADVLFDPGTVKEVYERVNKQMRQFSDYLLTTSEQNLDKYLRIGSLPFSQPFENEEEVHRRMLNVIDKIVFHDIPVMTGLNKESQTKLRNLLTLLSVQDRSSLQTLSRTLEISKPTLADMLSSLEMAEIISRIPPLGSIAAQARKTPKFKFAAPSFRVALLSSVGAWNDSSEGYGALIEDAVALMLKNSVDAGQLHAIAFDPEENGADFVVTCKNGEKIAIEVGYGKKQSDQVSRTMKRCDARYGLVVSNDRFRMIEEQRIIFIPRELFLI